MSTAAANAESFLAAGQFAAAIDAYTTAIKESPTAPDYYIKRSMAYHKSKDYSSALEDSEKAVAFAYKRGNRGLRAAAQFRRSLALFCLERPRDANFCLQKSIADGCKEKSIGVWQAKIDKALMDASHGEITVVEIPDMNPTPTPSDDTNEMKDTSTVSDATSIVPESKPKPKFEWYQTPEKVIVTFYVKKVPADKCTIDIGKTSLSVVFPIPDSGAEYIHDFEILFAEVDPTQSSSRVLGTKIEISLHKSEPIKWSALESPELNHEGDARGKNQLSYPTSSRNGAKNWDAMMAKEEDEKKDGDAALTDLFQTLYKDADEDTRKAMIKSYTESGGTALSTDWGSVKKGKVEVKPPDGMEAKTYSR